MAAAQGRVSTHAQTMRPATPQRTAEELRTLPVPTIDPVMVCVVETGTPSEVARNSEMAPLVSAQNPPTGASLVMRIPMVRTIRHPPESVPRPIAAWQSTITQSGISGFAPERPRDGRWPSAPPR